MSDILKEKNLNELDSPNPKIKKNQSDKYKKLSQLEHILLRSDTYVGSVEAQTSTQWVIDTETNKMVSREIKVVPALFKIFDEILVNAADNKQRDSSMNKLEVVINEKEGYISVLNNGRGIPIQMHEKEGVYIPELIFGHLLTSSNYNDKEKKVTGGRNGYGAKLCNIYSKKFVLETADGVNTYKQTFYDNMGKKDKPLIKKVKNASKKFENNWTKITFEPDWKRFGLDGLDKDTIALMHRRVWDMAGCLGSKGLKVKLNGKLINIKSFFEYSKLFIFNDEVSVIPTFEMDRWEVVVTVSKDAQLGQFSFVNSISTSKGGTHVNVVIDQISKAIMEHVQKKHKGSTLKLHQIKNHLNIFVNCLIENPSFDSQTKDTLTLKPSQFGSKLVLDSAFMKKIVSPKAGIMNSVLAWAKFKENKLLKKFDGSKTIRISGIPKLDDANKAGSREGHKCTLILIEGDSAKPLAVSGLSVVGRDYYGVFPLRGKLLNVRDAKTSQIMANAEITSLKKIMGLQTGKKYTDTKSLRYGHIMIMTDQDHDGSHIKGLVLNFIHSFWPSLLEIPQFLQFFITPIVRVSKGKQSKVFHTIPEYEDWKASMGTNANGWKVKYYKGLGTSSPKEAREYFSDLGKSVVDFEYQGEKDSKSLEMVFGKKFATERKEWLRNYKEGTFLEQSSVKSVSISDFVDKELILFSMADNIRSIPSIMDGMKPGQRKILYSCFKRKLKDEIKVVQLAGYTSEHSSYHHGEQSLASTIIGMAQTYVSSNNINLLSPNGQFGSRLEGGKDAASARYIYTNLAPLTRTIFKEFDDPICDYLKDDGFTIEPKWYVPIIPMILCNGASGIGTGWSTNIPSFNPKDIVRNIKELINGCSMENQSSLHPWYRGFNGTIDWDAKQKNYSVRGEWNEIDENLIEITELPLGVWTQSYKEFLEGLCENGLVKQFNEYHTNTTVHFEVAVNETKWQQAEKSKGGIEKAFKLKNGLSVSNMILFDSEGRLRRYNSPEEILFDFFQVRLGWYVKRKEYLIERLTKEWTRLNEMAKFILAVIEKKVVVSNRSKSDIYADLEAQGFKKLHKVASDDYNSEVTTEGSFDYLLSMSMWSLTKEKVEQLTFNRDKKEEELDNLLKKSPETLWLEDLDEFLQAYNVYENDMSMNESFISNKVKQVKAKPRKSRTTKPKTETIKAKEKVTKPQKEKAPIRRKISESAPPKPIKTSSNVSSSKFAFDFTSDSDEEIGTSLAERVAQMSIESEKEKEIVPQKAKPKAKSKAKAKSKVKETVAPTRPRSSRSTKKKVDYDFSDDESMEIVETVAPTRPRSSRSTKKKVVYDFSDDDFMDDDSEFDEFDDDDSDFEDY